MHIKKPQKQKSYVVSTRLNEDDYKIYLDKINNSGYKKSNFLREVILKNKTKVVNRKDAIHVLYHLNKMGNNLNQQAHVLNKAWLMGTISEEIFVQNLRSLNEIKMLQRNLIDLILYAEEEL